MSILIILLWLFIGFLGFLIVVAADMRGKQYDQWYYKSMDGSAIIMCVAGPIGFIAGIFISIMTISARKPVNCGFSKFVHKLVNIGSKNKDELFD